MGKKKRSTDIKLLLSLYLLLAPAIILLFIFNYVPMYGIIIAFMDFHIWGGIRGSDWVGLRNFERFLTDPTFWRVLRNTLIISAYDLIFVFTAPIIFALLANEIFNLRFKKIMQTISYLPHFISWVVVAGLFHQALSPVSGFVNQFLGLFGIEPIFFMTEPGLFRGVLIIAEIWKTVGWSAILFFAVIAGIDTEQYEAARIDGAGRFKQAIYITLPGMLPMIVLLFLMRVSNIFNVGFERVFLMQTPLVWSVSDIIATYTFRVGIQQSQFSLTTAITTVQSVIAFTLILASNWLSKKISGMGLF